MAGTFVELTPPAIQSLETLNLPKPVALGGTLNDPDSLQVVQVWVTSLQERPIVGLITSRWNGVVINQRFPADWWPAVQGVRDVNRFVWTLDPRWIPAPGSKQLEFYREKNGLIQLPRAVVTYFLPPGFNPEKTRALLYYEQAGITDCCGGWVAFEKRSGTWESAVPHGMELIAGSLR